MVGAEQQSQQDPVHDPRTRLARLPVPRHWITLAVVGVAVTLALGFAVKANPGLTAWEITINDTLSEHQHPVVTWFSVLISKGFSSQRSALIIVIVALVLLLLRRSPVNAVAFAASAFFIWKSVEVIKEIVHRPRLTGAGIDNPLLLEDGTTSFPSGHTTFIAALAISCYFLARRTRAEKIVMVLGVCAVVGMAFVRVYVSAHYLSDVLGACVLAPTAAIVFSGCWNRWGVWLLKHVPLLDRLGPIPA